jgi:hypothetical protein
MIYNLKSVDVPEWNVIPFVKQKYKLLLVRDDYIRT